MDPNAAVEANEEEIGKNKKCNVYVNRRYIPLKLIYFFFMAGEACALPYRSLFMKHLGMSTKQTGVIWTIERVISVILPPFLGAITDKTRRPKLVLIILLLSGSALIFSMYFVPQEDIVPSNNNSSISTEELKTGNVSVCWKMNCDRISPSLSEICILDSPTKWYDKCDGTVYIQITSFLCHRTPSDYLQNNAPTEDGNTNPIKNISNISTGNITICELHGHDESVTVAAHHSAEVIKQAVTERLLYSTQNQLRHMCVIYDDINIESGSMSCTVHMIDQTDQYGLTFWLLLTLVITSSFATIGSYPVIESSVLGVLGVKDRHKFGNQRLWASVGYGTAALAVGYFKDRASEAIGMAGSSNSAFFPMFIGVVICWACAAVVAYNLPIKTAKKKSQVRLRDIKHVVTKARTVAFFGLVFFYGVDNAVQEIYLFWLAEVKLNAPSFILGASTFVGAILDIPFCLMAGKLIRRFGHTAIITFGMCMYSFRLFFCSVITEPWQLVVVESSRCITWGLTWVVVCSYTAKISPVGLEALTMGLTQATLWGIGYSSGALIGGVLFQSIGGDNMFRLMAAMSMVASILFGIFTLCTRQKKSKVEEEAKEGSDGLTHRGKDPENFSSKRSGQLEKEEEDISDNNTDALINTAHFQ